MNMKKPLRVIILFVLCLAYPMTGSGQEAMHQPSKLQLAVEPEEIVLTQGITVRSPEKNIQIVVRETSGINPANLELAVRPFRDVNTSNSVDVTIIQVGIATPQAKLPPGGLQRVELTIGGFQQSGSYLGGITVHDTVSGEQREIPIRISVKDSWGFPTLILLVFVLLASGVNHWTSKGRRKNRIDRKVAELQHTITLAGGDSDPLLFEAEKLLEKAQAYNQDYQCERAEAAIAGVEQKFTQYEHKQQASDHLRQKIQELLQEIRLEGADPQQTRIAEELEQLLPNVQRDYEQTAAIVNQLEAFFRAYRLTKKDLGKRRIRAKLNSSSGMLSASWLRLVASVPLMKPIRCYVKPHTNCPLKNSMKIRSGRRNFRTDWTCMPSRSNIFPAIR
jgi:hypothetical protein